MLERKVKFKYIQLVTLSLIFSFAAEGKLKKIQVNNENLVIDTPNNWQIAKHFLNSQYTFFGPYKDGRRPVFSVNKTTLKDYSFNKQQLESSQVNYQSGRKDWLKKNKGRLLRFIPYKEVNWKHIKKVQSIGYNYILLDESFEERTYFFKCAGKVFNYTTLMTLNEKRIYKSVVDKILESTKCN